ncbi:MAG: glutathione S-transferase family protein [Gammaproteobacteria bacterium]|nr:glutathione S-transferase family protein [Gammaproteobacteria bacterium]
MYRVYGDIFSGNCYKIKLLMGLLQIDHEWIPVDILAGETDTPEFRAMNSNGKIPLLQIGESEYLPESNAILNYLAEGTAFLPAERLTRARVLQWQFFEQYSHEPYVAVARYIQRYLGLPDDQLENYRSKQEGGHKALAIMEEHLAGSDFFVGDAPTIADISLYAYTHVSHEGGIELDAYPNIRNWLDRIEALPNYVAMTAENA